jgi:outer membrane protein assembly factor BamB
MHASKALSLLRSKLCSQRMTRALWVVFCLLTIARASPALGQTVLREIDLAGVSLDVVDSKTLSQLDRAETAFNAGAYAEAVDHLSELLEANENVLVPVGEGSIVDRGTIRWLPLREIVQLRLVRWANESADMLVAWQKHFDPIARERLARANGQTDPAQLLETAERDLAATGASALLLRASEMAQRQGEFAAARRALARLIPNESWASVPETTEAEQAGAWGRLAVVSALTGEHEQARLELAKSQQLSGSVKTNLGGEQMSWSSAVEAISPLNSDAQDQDRGWTNLGGAASHWHPLSKDFELSGRPLWSAPIVTSSIENDVQTLPAWRPGDSARNPANVFPLIDKGLVVVADETTVRALELATGKERWKQKRVGDTRGMAGARTAGSSHFIASIVGDLVIFRDGPVATSARRFADPVRRAKSRLLAIELESGRLVHEWSLDKAGWSFDGGAVGEGDNLYVPLRYRLEGRPQSYLACYDIVTGHQKWRVRMASAEITGHGEYDEVTYTLPTLANGLLYVATHLGVVIALEPETGRPRWAITYRRTSEIDPRSSVAGGWRQRSASPCVVANGTAFVAPHDAPAIFAMDSETGKILWAEEGAVGRETVHLLGTVGQSVVATGDAVYFLDGDNGKPLARLPIGSRAQESDPVFRSGGIMRGYGRGLLTRDRVLWPMRDRLITLRWQGKSAEVVAETLLFPRGASGGNIAFSEGFFTIAGNNGLWCFDCRGNE